MITFTIKSDKSFLKEVRNKLRHFLNDVNDEIEKNRIVLATDEALSNIIIHGYEKNNLSGDITITIKREENKVIITLIDNAPFFDPVEYFRSHHLCVETAENEGRGIATYLKLMNVTYVRNADGTNQLTLFKEIT